MHCKIVRNVSYEFMGILMNFVGANIISNYSLKRELNQAQSYIKDNIDLLSEEAIE